MKKTTRCETLPKFYHILLKITRLPKITDQHSQRNGKKELKEL
ncbi:hypothetical protein ACSG3I_002911 [Enterococcus hirae]